MKELPRASEAECPKIMSSGVIGPLEELYARSSSRFSTTSCATRRSLGSSSGSKSRGFRTVKNSLSASGTSWRCRCSRLCEDQIASTEPVAIGITSVIEQMMSGWMGVEVEPDLPPFRPVKVSVQSLPCRIAATDVQDGLKPRRG